jgi:pimeloyl-ACP methyl ester carboxylesterase
MFRRFLLLAFVAPFIAGIGTAQSALSSTTENAGTAPSSPVSAKSPASPTEDWSRLPVDRNLMPLLVAGVSLGTTETASYTQELIRLQWRLSDPVDIWLVKPKGVEKPRVAIYLYSFPSDVDRFRDGSWCLAATQNGLAAVGMISALTGERFRARPMREWFIPELQESLGSTVHDVQLIIDYLARRGDLNVDEVGMFGQGSGGAIAILAAAADPRIHAIDLLNPWGDWPDWLKGSPVVPDTQRADYLTPDFLKKAAYVEPLSYLSDLKGRALRVEQILDYPNTPPAARDKIAAAVPTDDLVQFKDRTAHMEAWKTNGLSGWLADQLGAKTPMTDGSASK